MQNDVILDEDYIRISDIAKVDDIINNWLRSRDTLEFLGVWEKMYNPNFKVVEFERFKTEAGLHSFTLSVSEWVDKTNAIGLYVKDGIYAHKDIALEFATSISPIFNLYFIKELNKEENVNYLSKLYE